MAMDPREYELIALGHVLARYKIQGELPDIGGKPFDLNEFKQQLFAGVDTGDTDINVNIEKVENTVVDCDNEHEHNEKVPEQIEEPAQKEESKSEETQETVSSDKPSIGGKLFQFFSKDSKNES